MPKAKTTEKKNTKPAEEEKIIEIDTEEKTVDPELIPGEEIDEESEDEAVLDDEEINPFGDKWEE